jgi:hypothetical protein
LGLSFLSLLPCPFLLESRLRTSPFFPLALLPFFWSLGWGLALFCFLIHRLWRVEDFGWRRLGRRLRGRALVTAWRMESKIVWFIST